MLTSTTVNSTTKGTLFIPDISGFTQFINRTEVSHSKHIIEELLDLIVLEVGEMFRISEIEGDAVLFYNYEKEPDFKRITELAIRVFERFHRHLLYYNRDRVCDCGACSSSDQLTLKFIVHSGPLQEYAIGDRIKLFGREVILAHRLLKNSLDSREYLLITPSDREDKTRFDFLKEGFESKKERYEELGEVKFWYKSLSQYTEGLAPLPPRDPLSIPTMKLSNGLEVNSDLMTILRAVTEPEHRLAWIKNLRKIELKEHRINRIKTTHECLIGQGSVEVTIEELVKDENEVRLIERAKMNFPPMEFFVLYTFSKTENGIEVRMGNSLVAANNGGLITFFFPLINFLLRRANQRNLRRLKTYLENETL